MMLCASRSGIQQLNCGHGGGGRGGTTRTPKVSLNQEDEVKRKQTGKVWASFYSRTCIKRYRIKGSPSIERVSCQSAENYVP